MELVRSDKTKKELPEDFHAEIDFLLLLFFTNFGSNNKNPMGFKFYDPAT